MSLGFTKSKVDPNLYFKIENDGLVILLLYVDDLFLTDEEKFITDCKKFVVEFEMKDLSPMHYFLSPEVWKIFSLFKESMQGNSEEIRHDGL
jgi:hypothetical protein